MRPGILLRWCALKSVLKSEVKDGSLILDIGGYDGFIASDIKKSFPNIRITVVDTDKSGLLLAKERGLNTLCASALELPIEDNQVDVVFCLDLIEHIEEDNKLVKELARVLKIDGKVILTTPMQNGISFPLLNRKKTEVINISWGHVRKGYTLEAIEQLFQNNGLAIVRKDKYFNFISRWVYRFTVLSNIPFKINLIYKAIIKLEPYVKYGAEEHIIIGKNA
ncbi:Ubiquinone/menaquinone biosynthesis C-methylase UbiE [Candidatus Methanophagaceae archaeon]|jgi:SAM-dependent methyltransferase|nr:Ubiquinone/menaquinone biosynthesis C-methylase UbiE [Methanophagales archaeon]